MWQKKKRHVVRKRLHEQNFKCFYCHTSMTEIRVPPGELIPPNKATLDHIVPLSRGGKDRGLCVVACRSCNSTRGNMPWLDFVALTNARLKCK